MAIEVRTTVKLKPWCAPNFAALDLDHQQNSKDSAASIPVAELSEEALAAMAVAWLEDLYKKADKHSPFQMSALP